MDWFAINTDDFTTIVLSTIGIYIAVIFLTRLNGLRTFSKMSSFDFAITIAIGSVIASTAATKGPSLLEGALTLALLIACQRLISFLRYHFKLEKVTDNSPILLMQGKHIYYDALKQSRVTENDLYGKLREANVRSLDEVLAVVMEATGDLSVLHQNGGDQSLHPDLLKGVIMPS